MEPTTPSCQTNRDDLSPAAIAPALEPFVDGFSMRTVLGAIFVAVVMMPGAIYLGLVAGQTLGSAAEWVTILLFAEVARRSFTSLRRQEVYILFYVASGIAAVSLVNVALAGGPFAGVIWNQYLLQSPQTSGIAAQIPDWVVPSLSSPGIAQRNLAHHDWWWSASHGWLSPIVLTALGYALGRLSWFGLGYVLFRVTSDRERLPFPLAPIAAEGAAAVAQSTVRDAGGGATKQSWRWRVFSVGATLGFVFGAVYVLLPVVSGLFLAKPVMLLPIPFVDLTRNVEQLLPSSLVSFSFDIGLFLAGMILPFRLVLGTVTAILLTSVFGNPLLQHWGFFKHWTPGNSLLVNQMIVNFDFWMSVSLGLAGAVAIIGVWNLARTFARKSAAPEPSNDERTASKARGDFPLWVGGALFVVATAGFTWIAHTLVPSFPVWIILLFGFLWTPFQSYVSARLTGLTGQGLGVPYLIETAFIASGYKGADIWFAPVPLFDHGAGAQRFRELELTRTKFTSIIKAELLMLPVICLSSFLFWWFFWHLNQTPSDQFPFAARMWPVAARQAFLIITANGNDHSLLRQALQPSVIAGALGIGLAIYSTFAGLGWPVIFFYGMVGGVGVPVHVGLSLLIGALLGRYYFQKKFGEESWARSVPVAAAGVSCGLGLAGLIAVALSLIAHSTRSLPY